MCIDVLLSVPQLHLVQAWRLPTRLVLHLCTSNRINPPLPPPSGRTPSVGWIHLNVLLWPLWPILLIIPVKEGEAIETPLKLLLNCQSRHVVVLFLVLNFCRLCMLCLLCLCLINLSITIKYCGTRIYHLREVKLGTKKMSTGDFKLKKKYIIMLWKRAIFFTCKER